MRSSRRCCGARFTRSSPGRYAEYTVVDQAVRACGLLERWNAKGYVNARAARLPARARLARGAHPGRRRGALPASALVDRDRCAPRIPQTLAGGARGRQFAIRRCACASTARRTSVAAYQERLPAAGIAARTLGDEALLLERPVPVERLPGFDGGEVSVQDAGAQRAAHCLELADGQRVLDACAAPGRQERPSARMRADVALTALDADAARCARLERNLARLGLARARAACRLHAPRRRGGTACRSTAFWRTCPARPRASRGGIRTSSGCAGPTMSAPSLRARARSSMRFGRCLARMVNCCMPPARCSRRRTTR